MYEGSASRSGSVRAPDVMVGLNFLFLAFRDAFMIHGVPDSQDQAGRVGGGYG
jgi:hypothetical protein